MKKIVFIVANGDKKGHIGNWTTKLCHSIGKKGYNVTVITNKLSPEKYLNVPPCFKLIELSNGKYAFEKYENKPESLPYWFAYFRNSWIIPKAAIEFSQKEKVDAIFISGTEYMTFSLLLRYMRLKQFSIPPIVWGIEAPNFSYGAYPGALYKKIFKSLQRRFIKGVFGNEVKTIGTVTEWHKNRLREQLQLPDLFPIEVYGDGADEAYILDKYEAREKLGIKFKGLLFLFLGMIRDDKGIEDFIKATSYLKDFNMMIMIIGWPMHYTVDELNNIINKYGSPEKIFKRFEYVPENDLPLYYSACDVVVFPYNKMYTGGTGPLTKGACAYGKPVIITNVSGMFELVKKHKFGLIAEAQNPYSIAEKMKEFMNLDEAQKMELSKNSLSLGRLCSWDNMAYRVIEILKKASNSRDNYAQ